MIGNNLVEKSVLIDVVVFAFVTALKDVCFLRVVCVVCVDVFWWDRDVIMVDVLVCENEVENKSLEIVLSNSVVVTTLCVEVSKSRKLKN